jgi:2-methylisocitrate lyase-like PEP mutase family enzyme
VSSQIAKAETFRKLHHSPVLIIGNAWDAVSARIFQRAGFAAVGSSSAAVAFMLGYPDGQRISRAEMLEGVARIARAVDVPVTADVEAGYDDPVATARGIWDSGAVGMNLEDTAGGDLIDTVPHIRAIRQTVPGMVINARTDIFLNQIGEASTRFDRAVERLNAYLEAGADCAFAPGVRDADTIARLVKAVRGPLNILAAAGTPSIAELKSMGVARVSVGSGPMRATLGLLDRIARELHDSGTYTAMIEGAIPYADVNRLLS